MDKDDIYAPFLPQGDTLDPDLQKDLLGYEDPPIRPQMPFQQHRATPPLHPPIIGYPPTFPLQSAIQLPLVQQNYQAQPFITVPPVPLPPRTYGLHPIPQQQAPVNLRLRQSSVRPPSTVPANLPAVPATPGPPSRQMIPLRTGRNTLSFKTLPFENITYQPYLTKLHGRIDPVLGRIYKEEYIIKSEVIGYFTQYLKPCEFQSFDYIFLCKEILGSGDLNAIPFLTFLKAAVYIGKGKGYRECGHLKNLMEQGGSNAAKLIAISEMLDGDGVIIHRNNNFSCEHISHYYEGSAIDLLYKQISNDKPGFFPGKVFINVDESTIKNFGFLTLLRSYLSFIELNHFVVTRDNYEVLFKNKYHQIGAKVDQNEAFSKWNLVTADYSNTLTDAIDANNFDNRIYNEVWDKFKNVVPEQCYVFLILDGKHIPIPKFKRKEQNEYDAMNDHDDVLLTNFDMRIYLGYIVGIGIENNTERHFKMLRNCNNTGPFNVRIQELLNEETGLFL